MDQPKKPVDQYYYSESEWARLGCGTLPPKRDCSNQLQNVIVRGNPPTDGKAVKGYN